MRRVVLPRNLLDEVDVQSEKRTTARFMTQSGSASSREGDIFDESTCSIEVRSSLDCLAEITRKRLEVCFNQLYIFAAEGKVSSSNHNGRVFSQLQQTCCSSIFEVVALRARKQLIRAFFTIRWATGLGGFCELDVMRRMRQLASSHNYYEPSAKNSMDRQPPVAYNSNRESICTFSVSMNELLLERTGSLLESLTALQKKRLHFCFERIRLEAERTLTVRSARRLFRRKPEKSPSNRINLTINTPKIDSKPDQDVSNDAPPRPNRITRNFQQYKAVKTSLGESQLMADSKRSNSRGRNILSKMESIINELNEEIRERSRSKSPLNSNRNSTVRTSERPMDRPVEQRNADRSRSPLNKPLQKIRLQLSGINSSDSVSSTYRSSYRNDQAESSDRLYREDECLYEVMASKSISRDHTPGRNTRQQDENQQSKSFLRNAKTDRYKNSTSPFAHISRSASNQALNQSVPFQQSYPPQPYEMMNESHIYLQRPESNHQQMHRMDPRAMNYQQQPMYQEYPQGHFYPPQPLYSYYPPGMIPPGQFYYPPQHMPYYLPPRHGFPMPANNLSTSMNASGIGAPHTVNPNATGSMPISSNSLHAAQYPQFAQPYANCIDGRFAVSHNTSTQDSGTPKDPQIRNSNALLGEINNSFIDQSFQQGHNFVTGQCGSHKVCSCFPME